MTNPWLSVPLDDYEAHMSAAGIGQLDALAGLFDVALRSRRPASVAVLGIAGGNGLALIDSRITTRVVGVDVNPAYLDAVRRRYPGMPGLEPHCADLAREALALPPVQLVHAALVFEHAGTGLCLENALSLVAPGGALSVVLQLPGEGVQEVGPSAFAAMQALKPHLSLIDPEWLVETLAARGFELPHQCRRPLPGGKAFWMGVFARSGFNIP
jgi:threonine dehydrogenase-like Zn-dependent dehydrogenase